MGLQEQARKAVEEARAAARRQERQAADARQKAESREKRRLDAALREHVEARAASLGTTVSKWTTPTHKETQDNLWEYGSTHWTHWVTATFTADGIRFKATLCNGTFAGVRLDDGTEVIRSRGIESLLDLGEELDRLSKQRPKPRRKRT